MYSIPLHLARVSNFLVVILSDIEGWPGGDELVIYWDLLVLKISAGLLLVAERQRIGSSTPSVSNPVLYEVTIDVARPLVQISALFLF